MVWSQNPIIVAGNGTAGNGIGMLYLPWDVSIDSNFNLYVSDYGNSRIMKFSSGSTVGVSLTNGSGGGLSQVYSPAGSVIDTYGDLYVVDASNARTMKYPNISSSSRSLPIIGQLVTGTGYWGINYNQQQYALGVAVDTLQNVYVSDYSSNRVMKWIPRSSSGILVAGIGNGSAGNGSNQLFGPIGIFVDQNFTLYIADYYNHRIQKWSNGSSAGSTVAGSNGQLNYPTDVIVDTSGTIYAWCIGGLYRFYPGSTLGTNVISSYIFTYGFQFDTLGNVYAATSSHMVVKYTVNGTNCSTSKSFMSLRMRNLVYKPFLFHR